MTQIHFLGRSQPSKRALIRPNIADRMPYTNIERGRVVQLRRGLGAQLPTSAVIVGLRPRWELYRIVNIPVFEWESHVGVMP